MSFIKKVFEKRIDDSIHSQFVRFGKGVYKNRAIMKVMRGKELKVNSTFEYVNDFIELISEINGVKFTGTILSRESLKEFFTDREVVEDKKSGLYSYRVYELDGNIIKRLKDKSYYMLLDARADGIEFKCKKKLPKPGRSEESKADDRFCILLADLKYWPKIRHEFFPDAPENAKKCIAKHTFEIEKIILPPGEKDYEKARVLSKRAGKIKRFLEIDKKEEIKECGFEA